MANKIPLFERTEVGPTRAGSVKPGFDLARGAGLAEIGVATSRFAGAIFDDLVATTAANEEATHQGVVRSEMAGFDTFVAANPQASFEQLEAERDKMFARIDVAGKKATTRKAQQNIKNFMARNKNYMLETTQASMESIRVKQELLASQTHVKSFMTNFDRPGLKQHYEDMLEAERPIYNRDVIFGPVGKDGVRVGGVFEEQVAIIDKAEKKVLMGQLKTDIESQAFRLAAESGLEAAEEHLRNPEVTAGLIEAGMTREDARSLLNDISERVKHETVQADEKLETQREVDRGSVYDAINAGTAKLPDGTETTDLRKFIESTSLDEDEQESMWQKAIAETDRKLKGEDIITNPRVRSQFYKEIPLMLSGAVTRDELLDRANNARFGETVGDAPSGFTGFPTKHPTVDGSNVLLSGFEIDGKEYVIPTMVGGEKLTDKQAVEVAKQNGLENYPSFDTVKEANKFAEKFHDKIAEDGTLRDVDGILSEPDLNEKDYAPLVKAINAQYEQGFGQMMSKVTDYAEGILLQPDRFGIVDKPQVRYGIYADFQEAWFAFVAEKGEKLQIKDIYPEGRKLAASFILSQSKLLKREDELREGLEAREAGVEGRTEGETIQDYLKRTGK